MACPHCQKLQDELDRLNTTFIRHANQLLHIRRILANIPTTFAGADPAICGPPPLRVVAPAEAPHAPL